MPDPIHTIGRRKRSTARIFLAPGNGLFTVNGRELEDFFDRPTYQAQIRRPFELTETLGHWDIKATVRGGGSTGQAGALVLGISRALVEARPELRSALKKAGFLTRDPREVERKKPGQPGARKRFQFSKR
jgi:small subunit ribosomal protein S9